MSKRFKVIGSIIIVLLIVLIAFFLLATAFRTDDFLYVDCGKWIEITGCVKQDALFVIVPSRINNKPVRSIGTHSFRMMTKDDPKWVWIYIPDGVDTIKTQAISSRSIKHIRLPNTLKVIECNAFFEHSIGKIYLPENIETIEEGFLGEYNPKTKISVSESSSYFKVQNGLLMTTDEKRVLVDARTENDIVIPESAEVIDDYAFANSSYTSIFIPDSVKSIGKGAFFNSSLESINIPFGIEDISWYTFSKTKLRRIRLPSSIRIIEACAFYNCENLADVFLPNGLKVIGTKCFLYCAGLRKIIVPSTVEHIEESAFSDCWNLEAVYIYNDNITIESGVFGFCEGLTIYAPGGGNVEKYAAENDIPFVPIDI